MQNSVILSSKIEDLLELMKVDAGSSTFKVASIVLSMAFILFIGFLMTRLTKKLHLPNVTAYIVVGILIGPSVLNIIPENIINGTSFLSDIALAFIAFSAGEYFRIPAIKKAGIKALIITLFEALLTFILMFLVMRFILRIDTAFALVIAAVSSADSPASTLMTIRQTGAKGEYVDSLLEVIVFGNVFTLVIYSISISVLSATSGNGSTVTAWTIIYPILKSLASIAIGAVLGFLLKVLLPKRRTRDNRLIIVVALLFLFTGVATLMNESPLLGCMAMGMVYTNIKEEDDNLFKQINYFAPPILLIYFVRGGMNCNLASFVNGDKLGIAPMIIVILVYFITRFIGKNGGSYLGGTVTKSSKEVRRYLGFGLLPQASVAIGLATIGARTLLANGMAAEASELNTIILATSVIYEIVGPALAKVGLYLTKSYSDDIDVLVPKESVPGSEKKSRVELLIAQIGEIQKEIPKREFNEDEAAFTEAAEEYDEYLDRNIPRFLNRKR